MALARMAVTASVSSFFMMDLPDEWIYERQNGKNMAAGVLGEETVKGCVSSSFAIVMLCAPPGRPRAAGNVVPQGESFLGVCWEVVRSGTAARARSDSGGVPLRGEQLFG